MYMIFLSDDLLYGGQLYCSVQIHVNYIYIHKLLDILFCMVLDSVVIPRFIALWEATLAAVI